MTVLSWSRTGMTGPLWRGRAAPWLALLALTASPVALSAQTQERAGPGKELFQGKCAACHSPGTERIVGPGLGGVVAQRSREWLLAFITHPDKVIASGDSIATRLLAEYGMPMPSLGITQDEAALILDYLSGGSEERSGGGAGAGAQAADSANVGAAAEAGAPSRSAPAEGASPEAGPSSATGDPALGRQLFTGGHRLLNGGAPCISCHSVPGVGVLGGGTLARNLAGAAALYGAGLPQVLENPPFPLMQTVYGARALTPEEVAHLSAFLQQAGAADPQPTRTSGRSLAFPAAGLGGALLLMILTGVIWRGRLRGVREPLIGEGP